MKKQIVKFVQPWLHPIVREKTKATVGFGTKFNLGLGECGLGSTVKRSYDAYNESAVLVETVECFEKRTGHYPERVLSDQLYRIRGNYSYCKHHGIPLSGGTVGK